MIRIKINNAKSQELLEIQEITLIKLMGAGSHGKVYLTTITNTVIKIYDTATGEDDVNTEYVIFKKLIEYTDKNYPTHFVKALARGEIIKEFEFDGNRHKKDEKFILVPLYQKFYDIQTKTRRLQHTDFIIDFISILLKVAVFLERQLKIVHLDIKTSNLMYDQDKELILIDLGLVETIKHGHEIYVPEKKYFIWPYDSCYLVTIPVYSIAICVMEFFFGKLKVWQIQSLEEVKEYIDNISRRSKSLGGILYKMISLKYDPSTVLKYIEIKYKSDLEILDKDLDIQNISAVASRDRVKKRSLNKWFHTLIQEGHQPEK